MLEGWSKSEAGAPLVLWSHEKHGKWADGLFRLHDEIGFSLTDSLIECKKRGLRPCITQFRMDALLAGWSGERIDRIIAGAMADSRTLGIGG